MQKVCSSPYKRRSTGTCKWDLLLRITLLRVCFHLTVSVLELFRFFLIVRVKLRYSTTVMYCTVCHLCKAPRGSLVYYFSSSFVSMHDSCIFCAKAPFADYILSNLRKPIRSIKYR
jgi:hypothetical protein